MIPVKLDKSALENLGLCSEVIYLFEYDIPSAYSNPANNTISKDYTKQQAEFFREVRNKLMYALKFNLNAVKNLYSSWFITEDKLEASEKIANQVREDLIKHGFSEKADKVRIIPILTTIEGFQTYEQRKEEFFLEFLSDSQKTIDKGNKDKKLSDSLLWRVKKSSEIVDTLKETLKDKSKKSRYNEIVDCLTTLEDSIAQFESIKEKAKAKASKKKAKDVKVKHVKKV